MSDNKSFFLEGIVIGAIIGAASALLLAPQSGAETRQKLRRLKEDHEELINQTREKTEALISKTKESIEDGFQKLGQFIETKRQNYPASEES